MNHLLQHTCAVFFIVRAFDSLGLAFVLVEAFEEEAVVVVVVVAPTVVFDVDGASSSALVSDVSRASSNALTCFNLSSPQACFKNSRPA